MQEKKKRNYIIWQCLAPMHDSAGRRGYPAAAAGYTPPSSDPEKTYFAMKNSQKCSRNLPPARLA
jgi:hypothetical protein